MGRHPDCRNLFVTLAILCGLASSASAQSSIPGARAVSLNAAPSGVVREMTPERIVEAIAAGEKTTWFFWGLEANESTTEIGRFSTPFMRVAAAASRAQLNYRRLKPEDVTPELIKPELHVYVMDQGPLLEPRRNSVQAVVITNADGKYGEKFASAVRPLVFEELPESLRYGLLNMATGPWRVAVFPLDLLNENREVHVVFRESISVEDRDGQIKYACTDCATRLKFRQVR